MKEQALKTIRTLLPLTGSVTKQQIIDAVENALLIKSYCDLDKDFLIKEIELLYNIQQDDFRIIEANERRQRWIDTEKSKIEWKFWNRYRDYLLFSKNFPESILNQLDRLTDRTLDGLFNPTQKVIISKYGLVVGQVQSGKTSNYTGLICKAADAGFKLIIVLAGIHNNLRSQTQLRLDEGFLGFDTQHQRAFDQNGIKIGVGRFDNSGIAHSLTSSLEKGDFSANAANSLGINFNTNETIIAVVKKNASVLRNLVTWLKAQTIKLPDGRKVIRNKSLLLIDDEADNASINTKPEDDAATRINSLIREILGLFDKSGYVGYTATPFANIFIPINNDQLFPRDFIINIPAPSNYIGPQKVFGTQVLEDYETSDSVLPIVNRMDDYSDLIPNGHKRNAALPDKLPESLKTAIKCFILTCTIRRIRGQVNVHNSMLIHVSRFINWQTQIKILVEETFEFYRRGIAMNIPTVLEEIRITFEEDFQYSYESKCKKFVGMYKSYKSVTKQILQDSPDLDSQLQVHEWEDVKLDLYEASAKIIVKEINGGAGDVLNYYDHNNGLSVIAIGGDKLSRGLTLEGLSISYYLRASKMYDTLMQMGRWFGYRSGYIDLCRLFTSRELNEWFCHITLATEELLSEFNYMSTVAGSTPEQYALRVRTHPGVLQISASNKIRRAVNVDVSWSGRLVETYQLKKDTKSIDSNLQATMNFIKSLGTSHSTEYSKTHYIWKKCISADLIKSYLLNFSVPESLLKVKPSYLVDYINVCNKNNELQHWSVALMSKGDTNIRYQGIDGYNIGCWERNDAKEMSNEDIYYIKKNHIINSAMDETVDFSEQLKSEAFQRTKELNPKYKYKFAQGEIVRREFRDPNNPLLLIYFLDPKGAFGNNHNGLPLVGLAISFPNSRFSSIVKYAVHEQLLSNFEIDDDSEGYDDED